MEGVFFILNATVTVIKNIPQSNKMMRLTDYTGFLVLVFCFLGSIIVMIITCHQV